MISETIDKTVMDPGEEVLETTTEEDLIQVLERCTKQPAQTVGKNAKCLSNQKEIGLYIAETVSRSINQHGFSI